MSLAEKMVRYRAEHRLSQRELAEKCGVSLQTINSVENDTQKPSKVTEQKIKIAIGDEDNG